MGKQSKSNEIYKIYPLNAFYFRKVMRQSGAKETKSKSVQDLASEVFRIKTLGQLDIDNT